MGLENATFINDLVGANPTGTDPKSQGDDHLRMLKLVLQATFAGFTGAVLVAGTEAAGATANDYVVTISPAPAAWVNRMLVLFKATHANPGVPTFKVNALAPVPIVGIDQVALAANDIENAGWVLIAYDSAAAVAVLLSGNDRVSRNGDTITGILTVVGSILGSPAATLGATTVTTFAASGTATGPTPATGDATTRLATTEFVRNTSFTTNLPGQLTHAGEALMTDGINASWQPRFHEPLLALGIV